MKKPRLPADQPIERFLGALERLNRASSRLIRFGVDRAIGVTKRFGPKGGDPQEIFEDDRNTYDTGQLVRAGLNRPVENRRISKIDWASDSSPEDPATGYSDTRYAAADPRYPILIDKDNRLLNGRHRWLKMKANKRKIAKVVVLPQEDIDSAKVMSSKLKRIELASGDYVRRYLPDNPLFNSGGLLRAATKDKEPKKPKRQFAPGTFEQTVKGGVAPRPLTRDERLEQVIHKDKPPGWSIQEGLAVRGKSSADAAGEEMGKGPRTVTHIHTADEAKSRGIIEKMRQGSASPEEKTFLRERVSSQAAKRRDPIAWLKAVKDEGYHADDAYTNWQPSMGKAGAIEKVHEDEPKPSRVSRDPIAAQKTEKRITKKSRREAELTKEGFQKDAQAFRDTTAGQLRGRHGLIQDIRNISGEHPVATGPTTPLGTKPKNRAPIKLLGHQATTPEHVASVAKYVDQEVASGIERHGYLSDKGEHHGELRVGAITAVKRRVIEGRYPGQTIGPKQHAEVKDLTDALGHPTKTLEPFDRKTIASNAGMSEKEVDWLHNRLKSEPDVAGIRKRAIGRAIPALDARAPQIAAASESYPALKKIGRKLGLVGAAAGVIGSAAYIGKNLHDRRKKRIEMSSRTRLIQFSPRGFQYQKAFPKITRALFTDEGPARQVIADTENFGRKIRIGVARRDYAGLQDLADDYGLPIARSPKLIKQKVDVIRHEEALRLAGYRARGHDDMRPVLKKYKAKIKGTLDAEHQEKMASLSSGHERELKETQESHAAAIQSHKASSANLTNALRAEQISHENTAARAESTAEELITKGRKTAIRTGIIAGAAGVGTGTAIGYASRPKKKVTQFAARDPNKKGLTAHDVAIGGIEGGLGVVALDPLLRRFRKSSLPVKIAIGTGVGAAATGAIGYALNKMSSRKKSEPIQFDAPVSYRSVAPDRYRKKIHEADMDRAGSNYLRSAIAGGVLAKVAGRKFLHGAGAGLAVQGIVRAGTSSTKDQFGDRSYAAKRVDKLPWEAGGLVAGGILAKKVATSHQELKKTIRAGIAKAGSEIGGFKSGLRTAGRTAAIIGGSGVAVYGVSKLYDAMQRRKERQVRLISRVQPILFERKWHDKWTENVNVDRRAEDLYRWGGRGGRLVRDVKRKVAGTPILDARGREQTPEWKKPWAKRALVIGGLSATVGLGLMGHRGLKRSAATAAIQEAEGIKPSQWGKLAQNVTEGNAWRAVKKTVSGAFPKSTGVVKEAAGEIKQAASRIVETPAGKMNRKIEEKVGKITTGSVTTRKVGDKMVEIPNIINPAERAEKAAELAKKKGLQVQDLLSTNEEIEKVEAPGKKRLQDLFDAIHPKPKKFAAKGRVIQLAEYNPDWRTTDARGNSVRVFAPSHQTRNRRPKEWYERKQNRDLLGAGILGVTSAAVLGIGLRKGGVRAIRRIEQETAAKVETAAEEVVNKKRRAFFRGDEEAGPIRASSLDPLIHLSSLADSLIHPEK